MLYVQQHFAVKERFLSPRQKLLVGLQIDTWIAEWWSRKRRGLRNDLMLFADFTDEQRDLPMDTQQVGGRMGPGTQVSLIGGHLHRNQSASCYSLLLSLLFFVLQSYG